MNQPVTYEAHAFHSGYEKGKSSGQLEVSRGLFRFSGGGRQLTLPMEGASVRMGGASNRLVFIEHPAFPDWTLFTADRRLLKDPHLAGQRHLAGQAQQARRRHQWGWAVTIALALLVLAIPVLLLFQMDRLTAVAARHVPPAWEENLGSSVLAQYQLSHKLMPEKEAERYLAPLTGVLVKADGPTAYPYRFYISNDSAINAFALPGGHIVINSGLILAADKADEVLGVVAHEMTHVRRQHGIRSVMGGAGIFLVVQTLLGDVSGLLTAVAGAAPLLLNQSYSRGFEREADRGGLALLRHAHINPEGLLRFFEKVRAEEKRQLAKIKDERAREVAEDGFSLLNSHPATEERMAGLRKAIDRLPSQEWRQLDSEFSNLKIATLAFTARTNPEEPSEQSSEQLTQGELHASGDQGQ